MKNLINCRMTILAFVLLTMQNCFSQRAQISDLFVKSEVNPECYQLYDEASMYCYSDVQVLCDGDGCQSVLDEALNSFDLYAHAQKDGEALNDFFDRRERLLATVLSIARNQEHALCEEARNTIREIQSKYVQFYLDLFDDLKYCMGCVYKHASSAAYDDTVKYPLSILVRNEPRLVKNSLYILDEVHVDPKNVKIVSEAMITFLKIYLMNIKKTLKAAACGDIAILQQAALKLDNVLFEIDEHLLHTVDKLPGFVELIQNFFENDVTEVMDIYMSLDQTSSVFDSYSRTQLLLSKKIR